MRPHHLIPILLLLLAPACRRNDGTPPSLAILSPSDGATYTGTQPADIQIHATDQKALAHITLQLIDQQQGTIITAQTYPLKGTNTLATLDFTMGDRYTPTATYQLLATAFDAAGNSTNASILIGLTELPYRYLGAAWITDKNLSGHWLQGQDSFANPIPERYIGDTVSALMADNRNQQLVIAAPAENQLLAFQPHDFQPRFTLPITPAGSQPNAIAAYQNQYYTAFNTPPYLRVATAAGEWQNNWDALTYPAKNVLRTKDRVYIASHAWSGNPIKLDAYMPTSEQITTTNVLGWDASFLALTNQDLLLAAGDLNGHTQIALLDPISLLNRADFSIPSAYVSCTGTGDNFFILSADGVRELDVVTQNLSPLIISGTYHSIAHERTSDQLWLGISNGISKYTKGGNVIETIPVSGGHPSVIQFHYNK